MSMETNDETYSNIMIEPVPFISEQIVSLIITWTVIFIKQNVNLKHATKKMYMNLTRPETLISYLFFFFFFQ